ncbi:MAG: S8 family serine peptidase [Bacteroidetes bacterium]|nr:S8 family serine peptidase [Bacteroidota bacterium]
MYCKKCGAKIKDGEEFCSQCGAKIEPIKTNASDNSNEGKKKKPKKKNWVKILILVLIIGIIITAAYVVYDKSFPIEVYCETSQKTTTTTGVFEDVLVTVQSNQIIKSIYYAVDPADPEKVENYSSITATGSLFEKDIKISELSVLAGRSNLYIYVTTVFGQHSVYPIKLKYNIGYTSAPDESSYVTIEDGIELISNELLIIVKDGVSKSEVSSLVKQYDGEIVGQLYIMNQYQVRFSGYGESYINNIKEQLEQSDIVDSVSYNISFDIGIDATPNDTKYDSWDESDPSGNNWGLECIDALSAWDYDDQMSTVKVGVIDSSLQYSHKDLQINQNHVSILPTDDFSSLKDLEDYYSKYVGTHVCQSSNCVFCSQKDHGTHCVGIIGAIANNSKGICGVNWNTEMYFTTLWYYSIAGEGQLSMSSTTAGLFYDISYMVMSGCRVVSMSFGSSEASSVDEYEIEVTEAYDKLIETIENNNYDFLLIKAAGNDDADASDYYLNRIMTGGTHSSAHTIIAGAVSNASSLTNRLVAWLSDAEKIYNMANSSNYGNLIDVTAPGTNIYSTVFGNDYEYMSGTSMADPIVAGVASLIYSLDENFTYETVKNIVCNTSKIFCSKDGKVYSIVNAKNAVEFAAKFSGVLPELETPTVGFVTGIVQDAKTMELLDDVAVYITNNEIEESSISRTDEGIYDCLLSPGTYSMEFFAEGYNTEIIYNVEITEGVVNYNVLLNLVEDSEETGTASGRIVDAFDASSISNATLKFYAGINQTSGDLVTTITSDSNGKYSVSLTPGNYTVYISADGYLSDYSSILIIGGQELSSQDFTLTPILKDGEVRIVLTWGEYPSDLDSHLVGPSPSGGTFHIYYRNKNYYYSSTLYDNLDVDDTTSYGPETTSVYIGLDGTYTFYVHDYSNKIRSSSTALSTSGAQVKIYVAGQSSQIVYNVPNQQGTLWTVCSITDGVIISINTMNYKSSEDNIGE